MKKIIWIIVIVVVIGLLVWAGKGTDTTMPPTGSTEPIKIGLVTPLTGDAAALGEFMKNVTDLAVAEINEAGGVNGQMMEIIYEDGKCSGAPSVSATQKLLSSDQVKIIMGAECSGGVLAMLPVTDQAGVFVFSSSATSPDLSDKSPLFARTIPSDASQGRVLAEAAITRGWKKVFVIQESSDYALGIFRAFESNYPATAGTITKEEYPANTTDFRSILAKAKTAQPDAMLFIPQSPGTAERLIKNFSDLKWNVPVMADDVIGGNPPLLSNFKDSVEGMLVAEQALDQTNTKFQTLDSNYKTKYNKELVYKTYGQAQYDLVYLVKEGLMKFGNDPMKIAAWVRTVADWEGASGKVTIGMNGDRIGGHVVRVVAGGVVTDVK